MDLQRFDNTLRPSTIRSHLQVFPPSGVWWADHLNQNKHDTEAIQFISSTGPSLTTATDFPYRYWTLFYLGHTLDGVNGQLFEALVLAHRGHEGWYPVTHGHGSASERFLSNHSLRTHESAVPIYALARLFALTPEPLQTAR